MTTTELLEALWRDYVALTPQAERIHALLAARGETIRHAHLALRTFDVPGIGIAALGRVFEEHGWVPQPSVSASNHVRARRWCHADPALPEVLVSELVVAEMSPALQASIAALVAQLPEKFGEPWAGRPWRLTHATYTALHAESEHAAWVAAFGVRAHHFTLDANALSTFPDLLALNAYLVEHGFTLDGNDEQSSTRADSIEVAFDDVRVRIPSCHYELARRRVKRD